MTLISDKLFNEKFYKNLDSKIDKIPSKEEAKDFIKQVFEPVQKQINDMISEVYTPLNTKVSAYVSVVELLQIASNPPSSIDDVVSWASKVTNLFSAQIQMVKAQIKPYVDQYTVLQENIVSFPTEINKLRNHLIQKISEKGWQVEVPEIIVPTLPPLPPIPSILL